MNHKLTLGWGIAFVIIGILGFIPGITTVSNDGMHFLLGLFMVDPVHNIIHLATGIVAVLCARSVRASRLYFQIFGVVYGLVTIVGFFQGNTVLGIIDVNTADNLLHLAIAVAALAIGFSPYTTGRASTTARVE